MNKNEGITGDELGELKNFLGKADSGTIQALTAYIKQGEPLSPEAIVDLGRRKKPEFLLSFLVNDMQHSPRNPEADERFGKIFDFVNRDREHKITWGDIGNSIWEAEEAEYKREADEAYRKREEFEDGIPARGRSLAGLAIVRSDYEGNLGGGTPKAPLKVPGIVH